MRLLLVKLLFIGSLGLALQGCESLRNLDLFGSDETEEEHPDWDAETFYSEAQKAMADEQYNKAIELYQQLESRYPFGQYSAQSQLDIAYAHHKNGEPEAALAAAERFIKIHPRNPNVDYAYYLRGLVNFNRSFGFLERFLPTDLSQRDQSNMQESYDNFSELIQRYPNSQYVADAKQRMLSLRNDVAMHEVHIARFYIDRTAYVAAANRANYVLTNYQRTPAIPYALEILQEAYNKLGLEDLSHDAARVYVQNYPDGAPVSEDYKRKGLIHGIWGFTGLDN